jgi:beta-lactamase class A
MRFLKPLLILSFQLSLFFSQAQTEALQNQIENFIKTYKADVGVGIYGIENGKAVYVHKDKHYPMQSVYKFHVALAVLNQVDKGKLALNQQILLKKTDLLPDTWSPMRDKYPEGNVEIPLSDILKYTVSQSDNNGCDILFRLVGGTKKVHKYIHKLGIKDIAIKATEEEMHKVYDVQFTNWGTPQSMIQALDKFYKGNILSKNSYDFLWQTMIETTTGPKRIKGLLPTQTIVAHKTGTSGTNQQGITAATNDIGIVTLPNGQHFAIVVFIANSSENNETNEKIIAEITKLAWNYFTK